MPPSLDTYQQAANSIYDPQLQGDITQATAKRDTTKSALEGEKPQVQQEYQSAIDDLTKSVLQQTGQINQLYTERLGGNFSGLQGNDLGMVFSDANKQQANIGLTRANRLAAITGAEANADVQYGADVSSLNSKYAGEKANYAMSNYNNALGDYNANQASIQRAAISASGRAATAASKPLTEQQTAAAIRSGLDSVKGGDNHVNPKDLAMAYKDFTGAGFDPQSFWKYFQGYWNPNQSDYEKQFYGNV